MSNLMEMESGKVFDSHKETLGSMLREGARLISVAQRKSTDERKRSSFFTNLFSREWEFAALKNLTAFGGKHNLFKTVWSYVCLCFDSGKTCGVSYFLPLSRLATILFSEIFNLFAFLTFLRYICYHEQGLFGLISRAQILFFRNFFNRLLIQARSLLDVVYWNFL